MKTKLLYYLIYSSVFGFSQGLEVTITTASTPFRLFFLKMAGFQFSALRAKS